MLLLLPRSRKLTRIKPEDLTDITFTITITQPEAARIMRLTDVLRWRAVFLWQILPPLPAVAMFTFIASDIAAFPYCAGIWIVAVCLFHLPASLRFRWFLRKYGGNPDEPPLSLTVHLTDDTVSFTPSKLVNVEEIKLYYLHDTLFFYDERRNEWTFLRRNDFPGEETWRIFIRVLRKQGWKCPRSLTRDTRH